MFGELSAVEWKAKEEKLNQKLAETKYKLKERKLDREQKKFRLEDLDDRLLDISVLDKETDVSIAEAKNKGKQILLEQAQNEVKYLAGKHTLQQHIWALDLATDELQIAGSKQRVEELRRAGKELGHNIDNRVSQRLGGL